VGVGMLPGVLQEIADVAGEDAALLIAKARRGTEVYFPSPKRFADRGDTAKWLTDLVGMDRAQKIIEACAGTVGIRYVVPMAKNAIREAKVREGIERGANSTEIALSVGCHIRTVHRIRKKLKEQSACRERARQNLTKREKQ
jgi:hypothetical protein